MSEVRKIQSALISVYHKDKIKDIVKKLHALEVQLYATGGTYSFIKKLGIAVTPVEDLTDYPSILGGRVKTLHPKIMGGILARRENNNDLNQLTRYGIPELDLIIVDLYPFEAAVGSGASVEEVIEQIDIGGISLIRAAAKNFNNVTVIPSQAYYNSLLDLLHQKKGEINRTERKFFASAAFAVSSHYDTAVYKYFSNNKIDFFRESYNVAQQLRYGENSHQKGTYYGDLNAVFEKVQGKELSYNNLLDIDAAIDLIDEFEETTFAIIKHNNACGCASREKLTNAWKEALAGDPVSAFGGILVANAQVDEETAEAINTLFYEILIAPSYTKQALKLLTARKNRIILIRKHSDLPKVEFRSCLNGVAYQDKDLKKETADECTLVTAKAPNDNRQIADLLFANRLVKQSKSNAIVLVKNKQLIGSGIGETSRIDALKHAIAKAKAFGFNLHGAVMASDAFFPFADSVEIANREGINCVIQPGGSKKDQDSIDFCNRHGMTMFFTGIRHLKH
jgi:phosphoribosylaminoimidazolecarboxamide formyltransferase/IMP cyclohydrolase